MKKAETATRDSRCSSSSSCSCYSIWDFTQRNSVNLLCSPEYVKTLVHCIYSYPESKGEVNFFLFFPPSTQAHLWCIASTLWVGFQNCHSTLLLLSRYFLRLCQVNIYLDTDNFYNFATIHHHNEFQMKQSKFDWSLKSIKLRSTGKVL